MSSCQIWSGRIDEVSPGSFYGRTNAEQKASTGETYAHRHVWTTKFGPIPDGLYVCHHCDNPPCVRLSHLFLGTHGDNMRDMAKKGRHNSHLYPELRRGERCGAAKLTEEQVREIRSRHIPKGTPGAWGNNKRMAAEYGVSVPAIEAVIYRIHWKHVL